MSIVFWYTNWIKNESYFSYHKDFIVYTEV